MGLRFSFVDGGGGKISAWMYCILGVEMCEIGVKVSSFGLFATILCFVACAPVYHTVPYLS